MPTDTPSNFNPSICQMKCGTSFLLMAGRLSTRSVTKTWNSSPFTTTEPTLVSVLILQMSYQVAIISINRPFLHDPRKNIAQVATQAMIISSTAISHIVKRYRKIESLANAPPFVMYHLVRAAVTHLFAAASKEASVRKRVSGALQLCTDALEEMRSIWSLRGEQTLHLIRELAAQWKVTWILLLKLSQPLIQKTAPGDGDNNIVLSSTNSAFGTRNAAIENNYWNIETYLSLSVCKSSFSICLLLLSSSFAFNHESKTLNLTKHSTNLDKYRILNSIPSEHSRRIIQKVIMICRVRATEY